MATKVRLKATEVEKDVLTLARERTEIAYRRYDDVHVSFSGGKDSTVVLNVAIEVATKLGKLPVKAFMFDEEAIAPETVAYCERVAARPDVQLRWIAAPFLHRNACSQDEPDWICFDPAVRHLWCREPPPYAEMKIDGVTELMPYLDLIPFMFPRTGATVCTLLGLRAQESMRRRMAMLNRAEDNWLSVNPAAKWITAGSPIYDWKTEDVWTAARLLGWDYNRAYDTMELAGVTRSAQRAAQPFGEQPLRGLWMYKECWPDLWEKMLKRVPGVNAAGLYANTPLWGAGGGVDVSGGDMQARVTEALKKWPEPERRKIARRLSNAIQFHERVNPGVPIPDTVPTMNRTTKQITVTWELLLTIATKGDLKNRLNVGGFLRTRYQRHLKATGLCAKTVGTFMFCERTAGHDGDCDIDGFLSTAGV